MLNDRVEMLVRKASPFWPFGLQLYARTVSEINGVKRFGYPENVTWKQEQPEEADTIERAPLLIFDDESAQKLMNELWSVGVRPSDVGTAGHLEATKQHLSDMRKLVSKAYGIDA